MYPVPEWWGHHSQADKMTHKVDEILVCDPFFWWQLWRGGACWSSFSILSSGQCACRPTWRYLSLLDKCYCIYAFHALWVCLHLCVMGLGKRGGIIQQRWHAQSPGPYQYLPPDTAGKIRQLVPWNTNHSQEGLRGNCAWNKNSETFRVLIPGPGDPPKDPASTAERWLLKLISYFIYSFFRKFLASLPILHCAITSPCTKPVFTTATTCFHNNFWNFNHY